MSMNEKQFELSVKFLIANAVDHALTMGLTDDLGSSVIHTNSSIPSYLILSITNTLVEEVEIVGQPGPPSETNCHFHIKFVDNALFTSPDLTVTEPNWLIDPAFDDSGFITDIYLLSTETRSLKSSGNAGSNTDVRLEYSNATLSDTTEAVLQIAVSVGQNVNAILAGGTEPVTGTETVHLTHFTDASAPSPLIASLVQPRTILNDGSTGELHLRFVNTSADSIAFAAPPDLGAPTPTAIQLSVDIDADAAWALCKEDEAASMLIAPPLNWVTVSDGTIGNGRKTWVFRPDYDKITRIEPNTVFDFHLTGVKTTLPPGFTNFYVTLIEFPLYGTQTSISQIEKSPLIYNRELNAGLLSAGATGTSHGFVVKGNTTEDLLLVDQAGTGLSAHFLGEAGVKVDHRLEVLGEINGATIANGFITGRGLHSDGEVTVSAALTADKLISQTDLTTAGLSSSKNVTVFADLNVSGALYAGGNLTVNSVAEFQGVNVHGTTETSEQIVHGPATVDSLSVGGEASIIGYIRAKSGARLDGRLTVAGPVEMFARYSQMSTNTAYTANTDGIVCAYVDGAVPAQGFCCIRLFGLVDGLRVAQAMGGNIGTFVKHSDSDYQAVITANMGSITFPVPIGATWRVDRLNDSYNQSDAPVGVYWIPVGKDVMSDESEPVAKTDFIQHDSKPQTYESDVQTSISDLVTDLGSVFSHNLSDEEQKRLEERVFKLVQKQASPKKPETYDAAMSNLVQTLERVLKQSFTEQEKTDLADAVKQLR